MKYVFTALIAVAAVILLAAPAMADFPDNQNTWKWAQFPNDTGQPPDNASWDVNFTFPNVLADDFKCDQRTRITDVHIWFSVIDDVIGFDHTNAVPDPAAIERAIDYVHLSIHDNDPGDPPEIPSMPTGSKWAADFQDFKVQYWAPHEQGWIEPGVDSWFPDHQHIWLLNVYIPESEAFLQEGTPDNPITYWLDASVKLKPGYENVWLGWKTAESSQIDDAVYGQMPTAGAGDDIVWGGSLVDPITEESLDLAFIITPEPGTMAMLIGAGLIGLVAFARRRRKS